MIGGAVMVCRIATGKIDETATADDGKTLPLKFQTETLPRLHSLSVPGARVAYRLMGTNIPGFCPFF
jgi:hypothetical protein